MVLELKDGDRIFTVGIHIGSSQMWYVYPISGGTQAHLQYKIFIIIY